MCRAVSPALLRAFTSEPFAMIIATSSGAAWRFMAIARGASPWSSRSRTFERVSTASRASGPDRDGDRERTLAAAVHEEDVGAGVEEDFRVVVSLRPERNVERRIPGRVLRVDRRLGGDEGANHLDRVADLDRDVEGSVAVAVLERGVRAILEEERDGRRRGPPRASLYGAGVLSKPSRTLGSAPAFSSISAPRASPP